VLSLTRVKKDLKAMTDAVDAGAVVVAGAIACTPTEKARLGRLFERREGKGSKKISACILLQGCF